jgi:hypothetical protein
MTNLRNFLILLVAPFFFGVTVRADEIVLDGPMIVSGAVASKGANCPANEFELEESTGRLRWTIAASPSSSYDFGKLEIPLGVEISPQAIVTIDLEAVLAEGSCLEMGLQFDDGRYYFTNLRENEASGSRYFEFSVEKMASACGTPYVEGTATVVGLTLMVNSDDSPAEGTSELLVEKIKLLP